MTHYHDRSFTFLGTLYQSPDKREVIRFLNYWDEVPPKKMPYVWVGKKSDGIIRINV